MFHVRIFTSVLAAPNAPAAPEDPEVAESQPWYLQCAVPMPVRGDTTATTVVVTAGTAGALQRMAFTEME